jgi:regulator of sigma E protease
MGILTFVLVLGILIFVHEFGHFIFAKRAGVGVEKFSIGFGPKIFGFTRGETEYQLALIPLGGYVKMFGDNPDEGLKGGPKDFLSRPVRDRLPIVLAGPFVNLALAFMLMPVVYMIGVNVPAFVERAPDIGYVIPDSPAAEAGLIEGDRILAINGVDMATWESVLLATMAEPGKTIDVRFARNGETQNMPVRLGTDPDSGIATFGIQPEATPLIGLVSPGSPADQAGLQAGDRIAKLQGEPVRHWVGMSERIQAHGAQPLEVTYVRDGSEQTVTLTPMPDGERVILGIQRSEELILQKYGFFPAIKEGVGRVVLMTQQTFQVLGKLVTGQLGVKTLGGPVRIAQVTTVAAEHGLADVLSLMAFLSLQLGILNLMPFPILDGGHVMFMGIEAIRRRPVSRKALEISTQVGFVLLLVLMVVVTKNDIMHAWGPQIQNFFDQVKNLF